MDKARSSYVYAGLAIFFWSTVPTAFKISLGELAILPMLTIASLTSAIVLTAIVVAGGKAHIILASTGKELLSSAILGLINPFLYYIILLRAYQLLPA
ncbi:MAG TPA: EamA family transporter [Bacteroidales bacterium]|nr:EamA family transporter [Bacteroidales bacterium]